MIEDAANDALDALSSCPCCLLRPQQRGLKTPYTHLGKTEIYSDMLKECFDIRLNVGSEKSGICEVCVGRLRDASNFKLQVHHSQKELRKRLKRALGIIDEEPAVIKSETGGEDGTSVNLFDEQPTAKMADKDEACVIIAISEDEEPDVKLEAPDEHAPSDCFFEEVTAAVKSEVVGGGQNAASDSLADKDCFVMSEMVDGAPSDQDFVSHEEPLELSDEDATSDEEFLSRAREQLAMACSVRLERLRGDEASLAPPVGDVVDEEAACACDNCGERFTGKLSLIKHIQEHMTETPCFSETCPKEFTKHERSHNGEKAYCEISSNEFTEKSYLMKHDDTYFERKPLVCEVCNEQFTDHNSLIHHILIHAGEKLNYCGICNKQFKRKSKLTRHMKIHNKAYTCNTCQRKFAEKADLIRHIRMYTDQKPYSCEICHMKFAYKTYLVKHIRMHNRPKPFSCEICQMKFAYKTDLLKHIRMHNRPKPYSCEICQMKFAYKTYFIKHIEMHNRPKPYSCNICRRKFAHKTSLIRHVRIHTGQKLYSCEVCNKKFARRSNLTRHIIVRRHSGQIPYSCNICLKKYALKTSLVRHITVHTAQKVYGCEKCNKVFARKSDLTRHIRTHSGQTGN